MFSLEMSKEQLLMRMLCAEARVDAHKVRTGYLGKDDFRKLIDTLGKTTDAPIFIDDSSTLTVMEMRAKCRRLKAEHGLSLVIVDYLQLMHCPDEESRQSEVAAISRGLKALAKELRIPVVALAQLNRGPEDRSGNRPRMSDLRESGAIEQDADLVVFLYKERSPEEKKAELGAGAVEVIVGKNRNGPTDRVLLTWLGNFMRFEDYDPRFATV